MSIRVHSWFYYSPFRAFRAFRGFECFIRVPSWVNQYPPGLRFFIFVCFVYLVVQFVVLLHSCPFVSIRGSIRGSIIPPFVSFVCFVVHPYPMDAWQNCRAGAPTRAIHALPSSPSSLFPTYQKPTAKSREQREEGRKQCMAGALGRAPHGHSAVLIGSPLQSVHALPSPPSSLLPT